MYIIVGLGNPGAQYAGTRHNIGFDALDYLAAQYRIPVQKVKHKSLIGEGLMQGEKILLVKPQTFMNLSGEAVQSIMAFYKVPPEQLIVLYDDIDLQIGKLRIRPSGSAGTHNGMRSIVSSLGTEAFSRVRMGVGKPPAGWNLADYVLSRFSEDERKEVNGVVERVATAVPAIVCSGAEAAMNRYNG